MKNTLLLLVLTGCGTTDPRFWQTCDACAADANALWDVIADGAEIAGDYDVVGPPDPYLCLTIGGSTHCSSAKSDDASPRWNETILRSATTSQLTAKSASVDLWD